MATHEQGQHSPAECQSGSCKHAKNEGVELVTCYACGDRFCPKCTQCACDRLASYLGFLHEVPKEESRAPLLQLFLREWAQ